MRGVLVAALVLLMGGVGAGGGGRTLGAQTIESPVAFDSAHRVLAVTPRMVERLNLSAPLWPVGTTEFREARLYAVSPGGGYVLVVQKASGDLQRFPMTDASRVTLQRAIDAATSLSGRPSGEIASDVVSEPAGAAFARRQTLLSAVVYGPVAASLTDDGSVAGALYLLTTGMSFFISYSAGQSMPFTRAQSDLAASLGLAAGAGAWATGYAATGGSERGVRGAALGAALVGTIAGVSLGQKLTDAEAHAATFGIENGTAIGLLGSSIVGANGRTMSAIATATGALGYPIGVIYPRRASYNVTAGDVEATSTASLIGALAGAAALYDTDGNSTKKTAGFLSAGYLLGGLLGDQWLARPFDFTQSQANIISVGAIAGAVVGAVVPVAFQGDNLLLDLGVPALGAALGAAVVVNGMPQAEISATRVGSAPPKPQRTSGPRFTLSPLSLGAIAGGVRGNHVLARLTF